jgi:hypothetical protein
MTVQGHEMAAPCTERRRLTARVLIVSGLERGSDLQFTSCLRNVRFACLSKLRSSQWCSGALEQLIVAHLVTKCRDLSS